MEEFIMFTKVECVYIGSSLNTGSRLKKYTL